MIQQSHFSYRPRQNGNSEKKKKIHAPLCSQRRYSQQPNHGNNLNIQGQMNA